MLFVSYNNRRFKKHLHLRPFFTEQAIDANNGVIYVGSIRKYSVNDLRDLSMASFLLKKKYWIAGFIIAFLLVATGIVVPISIVVVSNESLP